MKVPPEGWIPSGWRIVLHLHNFNVIFTVLQSIACVSHTFMLHDIENVLSVSWQGGKKLILNLKWHNKSYSFCVELHTHNFMSQVKVFNHFETMLWPKHEILTKDKKMLTLSIVRTLFIFNNFYIYVNSYLWRDQYSYNCELSHNTSVSVRSLFLERDLITWKRHFTYFFWTCHLYPF